LSGLRPDSAVSTDVRAEQREAFVRGLKAVAPGLVALSVWGLVTGVAMVNGGLTQSAAVTMSLLVYAGSAQLTALPLIMAGAPLWLIFVAGFVVNLRFVIFGAALHPFFRALSWPKRLLLGFLTVDVAFVVFMPRYADAQVKGTREQRWYYLGTIVPSWIVWQVTSVTGIALGARVPPSWSLGFAATLALTAMVLPHVRARPMLLSVMAAAVVAWIAQPLPLRLGLLAAVVAGIGVGMWAEQASDSRGRP
jgi:predicted branched-subunit amino acid permease